MQSHNYYAASTGQKYYKLLPSPLSLIVTFARGVATESCPGERLMRLTESSSDISTVVSSTIPILIQSD